MTRGREGGFGRVYGAVNKRDLIKGENIECMTINRVHKGV